MPRLRHGAPEPRRAAVTRLDRPRDRSPHVSAADASTARFRRHLRVVVVGQGGRLSTRHSDVAGIVRARAQDTERGSRELKTDLYADEKTVNYE